MSDVQRLVLYAWGLGLSIVLITLGVVGIASLNGIKYRGNLFTICQVALIYGMGIAVLIYTVMELSMGRLR